MPKLAVLSNPRKQLVPGDQLVHHPLDLPISSVLVFFTFNGTLPGSRLPHSYLAFRCRRPIGGCRWVLAGHRPVSQVSGSRVVTEKEDASRVCRVGPDTIRRRQGGPHTGKTTTYPWLGPTLMRQVQPKHWS